MTEYGLPEVSCAILNKLAYMDAEIWAQVAKVVAPGIRKMAVEQCCFYLLYFILNLSKSSSMLFQIIRG